jgi:SAM-dependent methyltransferase
MPIAPELLERCWNDLYAGGRYAHDPPLRFTSRILALLRAEPSAGRGLYVGCGNGRNFVPLTRAGLTLHGLDISAVALAALAERVPEAAGRLMRGDFQTFEVDEPFDYLVALQVFQHGAQEDVDAHFRRAGALVRPGGLFFVRVNSPDCDIFFPWEPLDRNDDGGYSVLCTGGPKAGQPVHFFGHDELLALAAPFFDVVEPPREVREVRAPPRTGRWGQWEAVFRRRSDIPAAQEAQ